MRALRACREHITLFRKNLKYNYLNQKMKIQDQGWNCENIISKDGKGRTSVTEWTGEFIMIRYRFSVSQPPGQSTLKPGLRSKTGPLKKVLKSPMG